MLFILKHLPSSAYVCGLICLFVIFGYNVNVDKTIIMISSRGRPPDSIQEEFEDTTGVIKIRTSKKADNTIAKRQGQKDTTIFKTYT